MEICSEKDRMSDNLGKVFYALDIIPNKNIFIAYDNHCYADAMTKLDIIVQKQIIDSETSIFSSLQKIN